MGFLSKEEKHEDCFSLKDGKKKKHGQARNQQSNYGLQEATGRSPKKLVEIHREFSYRIFYLLLGFQMLCPFQTWLLYALGSVPNLCCSKCSILSNEGDTMIQEKRQKRYEIQNNQLHLTVQD
jgi:hypothetical protein